MELSGKFLGAITLLSWACSTLTSLPTHTLTHPTTTVAAIPYDILTHMSRLPVHLALVREGGMSPTPDDDHTSPFGVPERTDWGPLVTHCYSQYWHCLSLYLKHRGACRKDALHPGSESGGGDGHVGGVGGKEREGLTGRGVTREAVVTVGCADVMAVMGCCMESLDVAAGSVGVIIESVSALLPKVIPSSQKCISAYIYTCTHTYIILYVSLFV